MWQLLDKSLSSRFILGTALYPSVKIMLDSINASEASLITVSLKRSSATNKDNHLWQALLKTGCHLLPNTAGCRSAKEAILMAEMAQEVFKTNWIKVEVIGDDYNLQPDMIGVINACESLIDKGFNVLPYITDDLVMAKHLVDLGVKVLMPWAAPIGSGKGVYNPYALSVLRLRFPNIQLIVDAGIGIASDAAKVMEMGFDGVLLNSAVALAGNPVEMALAFNYAIKAGRSAYLARPMPVREMASPSTALSNTPFWHKKESVKL
ncbi:thiazole synthase [Thiotrichales bacterium 19S3-7]|nr:thiazole synthase [Thiotrichales bacterium 19S3-7]MCF6800647.1 thiazole synthase [Thiotrichales bacterium 19S3-11]